jgi:hypothetical protein
MDRVRFGVFLGIGFFMILGSVLVSAEVNLFENKTVWNMNADDLLTKAMEEQGKCEGFITNKQDTQACGAALNYYSRALSKIDPDDHYTREMIFRRMGVVAARSGDTSLANEMNRRVSEERRKQEDSEGIPLSPFVVLFSVGCAGIFMMVRRARKEKD